jgi:excisionase family DNA binding protein
MVNDSFMTLGEAAEALGVSRATLWRRVQAGEIIAFQSQRDRRQKLVRRSDIEALMKPTAIEPGKEVAAQNLAA